MTSWVFSISLPLFPKWGKNIQVRVPRSWTLPLTDHQVLRGQSLTVHSAHNLQGWSYHRGHIVGSSVNKPICFPRTILKSLQVHRLEVAIHQQSPHGCPWTAGLEINRILAPSLCLNTGTNTWVQQRPGVFSISCGLSVVHLHQNCCWDSRQWWASVRSWVQAGEAWVMEPQLSWEDDCWSQDWTDCYHKSWCCHEAGFPNMYPTHLFVLQFLPPLEAIWLPHHI